MQRLADSVAAWFVPAVIGVAFAACRFDSPENFIHGLSIFYHHREKRYPKHNG